MNRANEVLVDKISGLEHDLAMANCRLQDADGFNKLLEAKYNELLNSKKDYFIERIKVGSVFTVNNDKFIVLKTSDGVALALLSSNAIIKYAKTVKALLQRQFNDEELANIVINDKF